jgi:methylated-DNA-[protein]-cysteine S-methyltransferase
VAYLEGERTDFRDVDVALPLPTDQRAVLEAVRQLPFGEAVSVEKLTRMTPGLDAGEDDDLSVTREALAANPAPLLIPDHRVRDGPGGAPADVEQKLRTLERL